MTLSLAKGQTISLTKADSTSLTSILLGLGWDEATAPKPKGLRGLLGGGSVGGGGSIDLDASAILLDASGKTIDVVYYGQRDSRDKAIHHTGDNLTGAGAGDDEQIEANLARINTAVATVLLTITSYSGHTFDRISNAFVRVVDTSASGAGTEVVKYDMSAESGPFTALVVAALRRQSDGGWSFTAIGDGTDARTPQKIDARRYAA